ncbi:MAG: hypothetical protein AAFP89_05175 [Bacteroidota bacterium]
MSTSRFTLSEGMALVSAYRSSGLSASAYSAQSGISLPKLRYWLSKLGSSRQSHAGGFVAVQVEAESSGGSLRMHLGATVLEFEILPPLDYLQGLLESVQT